MAIKALYCHAALINYYDDYKMSESNDTFLFDAAMCFGAHCVHRICSNLFILPEVFRFTVRDIR